MIQERAKPLAHPLLPSNCALSVSALGAGVLAGTVRRVTLLAFFYFFFFCFF